jgi:hypothetical protein
MDAFTSLLFIFVFAFLWYTALGILGLAVAWSVLAVCYSLNK